MQKKHDWWGTPRQITHVISDRKISWLELFSDLVFIIAIHYLISGLSEDISRLNIGRFVLVFLLVFDIWNNFVLYFDLHGNSSVRNTFLTIVLVAEVALLAATITTFFAGNYQPFIGMYLLLQVFMIYLWWRVVHFDPAHMLTIRPYLISAMVQLLLLVATFFIKNIAVQTILIVIVVLLKSVILISERHNFDLEFRQRKIPFEISDALQERYGTFTMIILGEAVATIVEQVAARLTLTTIFQFLLLMISVVSIFWLYYALIDSVHVKGKNYLKLVSFRGVHITFLLMLSLETFFAVNLFKQDTLFVRLGFVTSLILTISLIFILKAFSTLSWTEKRDFWWGGSLMLLLYGFTFVNAGILVLVSDLYLVTLIILHERALFLRNQLI
ncbi:low temperature requirement protein A [Lapidilactobacillus wuchangensis]|uniref:low temperature requirement protein A n=1 Tax=Lapidilactobacillus wuchangensis TaxID=2486001 RepID=UPI000F7B762C|nr:low temperature requirement protein A [Lapidilactobacillus wuchangensis]